MFESGVASLKISDQKILGLLVVVPCHLGPLSGPFRYHSRSGACNRYETSELNDLAVKRNHIENDRLASELTIYNQLKGQVICAVTLQKENNGNRCQFCRSSD